MAHINDLFIPSLSSLGASEGLQLILDIRLRRRFVPTKVPKERTKKSPVSDPAKIVNSLTDEQLLKLMQMLGDK